MSETKFWKLYREERRKLVRARQPGVKRPFSVQLSSAEIVHAARTARKRLEASR